MDPRHTTKNTDPRYTNKNIDRVTNRSLYKESLTVPILGEMNVPMSESMRATRTDYKSGFSGHALDRLRRTFEAFTRSDKDTSPEAKNYRTIMWVRSVYAEFMCTCLFMIGIYGAIANAYQQGWSAEGTVLVAALVSGFGVVAMTFAFSDLSGAQMNPTITFALWFTGRLSNRKVVSYIFVQLLASIVAASIISLTFTNPNEKMFKVISVVPYANSQPGKVFATEFICSFILTYVAFTVAFEEVRRLKKEIASIKTVNNSTGLVVYASTPQSKSGFAPFSIGFTTFFLSCYGGSSGVSMNPVRMLGPAVFSGDWDYFYLYVIADFAGAGLASWIVTTVHQHIRAPVIIPEPSIMNTSSDDTSEPPSSPSSSSHDSKYINTV